MYAVYLINANNQTMIHSTIADDLKLFNTKIAKDVDEIDSFNFSIYPNNPGYNQLYYLTTLVEVWNEQTNRLIFKGRVLEPTEDMDGNGEIVKEVVCEGELAYLHDSVQKWGKWQNMTPAQFFTTLINTHNDQVEEYKRFSIGVVDVTNTTDNVYRYTSDDVDTYDTIKDKLIDRLGGELQIRYANNVRYIDYLQRTGEKGTQKIELSVNLKSISRDIDPSDLITVLKPLGNRLEQGEDNTDASAPRLTIASVNNNDVYLRDEAKIKQFGLKVGAQVWDNVTQANILLTRGLQFLAEQKTALTKHQISAVDLSPLNLTVDAFICGWRYDVYNPLMSIDEELRVVTQTIDINDPVGSTLGIGDKILTQEQYNRAINRQIKNVQQIEEIVTGQNVNIATLKLDLKNTEDALTTLQEQVGAGEVQNQISAILTEMQGIVAELQSLADQVPTEETMMQINESINELNAFKAVQILINADFEERIAALEP